MGWLNLRLIVKGHGHVYENDLILCISAATKAL